jgi:TrmH family RNA methyltransferase
MNKQIQITSSQNEQIKRWKKLRSRKGREQFRSLLIEGEHLVKEALRSKVTIRSWILNEQSKEFIEYLDHPAPIYQLSNSLFASLMETQAPQGIAAEIEMKSWQIEELLETDDLAKTFLLLDAIQDPGNLGTILRTAEAAKVTGIFLGQGTVDRYNPKVVRAAMGSVFRLPIVQMDLSTCFTYLKENGVTIVNTSPHAGNLSFEYQFPRQVAILLGNEGNGVHSDWLSFVDDEEMIPMPGNTESLNVAVTSAILLYERIRQLSIAF